MTQFGIYLRLSVSYKSLIISLKQEMETPWCVDKLSFCFRQGLSLNPLIES